LGDEGADADDEGTGGGLATGSYSHGILSMRPFGTAGAGGAWRDFGAMGGSNDTTGRGSGAASGRSSSKGGGMVPKNDAVSIAPASMTAGGRESTKTESGSVVRSKMWS
jgi:hypothetical protein